MISMHSRDLQGTLISAGIMAHMAIQVILNISVVTNTIPNTGNYPSFYQLRRYLGNVSSGRNGDGAQRQLSQKNKNSIG